MAIANIVHWYNHVLRREDSHVLERAKDFEAEGQRKKGRLKRIWKKQDDKESVKVSLSREDALYLSKWVASVNMIATR